MRVAERAAESPVVIRRKGYVPSAFGSCIRPVPRTPPRCLSRRVDLISLEAFDSGTSVMLPAVRMSARRPPRSISLRSTPLWVSRSKWAQGSQSRRPTHSTSPTLKRNPTDYSGRRRE